MNPVEQDQPISHNETAWNEYFLRVFEGDIHRVISVRSPLVIVVRSIPTVGEDGVVRNGGNGNTTIAEKLATALNTRLNKQGRSAGLVLTGEVMRERFFEKVFAADHPNTAYGDVKNSDAFKNAFYEWRFSLSQNHSYDHDKALDDDVTQAVIDQLRQHQVFVIDSKVFSDIKDNQGLFPNMLVIGVKTDDTTATHRQWQRDQKKNPDASMETVAKTRQRRFEGDQVVYSTLYQSDYTPEAIAQRCHIVIDNSTEYPAAEISNRISEMVSYIVQKLDEAEVLCFESPVMAQIGLNQIAGPESATQLTT